MRRFPVFSLVPAVLLSVLFSACGKTSPERATLEVSGDSAMKYALEQIAATPRHSGSPGAEKAADSILSAARGIRGFKVSVDEFSGVTPDGEIMFRNVIAEYPGRSAKFIVIGAHYDTKKIDIVPEFQGANDGASGVGALLAMMGSVSKSGITPEYTLRFMFFDGEECIDGYSGSDGLHGSRRAAEKLAISGEKEKCRAMILLDMVGDADLKIRLPSDTPQELEKAVLAAAERTGHSGKVEAGGPVMLDDHIPFAKAGIPSVDLIDFSYGPNNSYWHSRSDSVGHISGESMKASAEIALETALSLK